uniref:Uncharacterized protein n=1 Tax=Sus scrofa TaxID=9823 RepID=A0A4X1SJA9_PIG
MALGVLTLEFGPLQRPVAYLSKQIDSVAAGWPPCLQALAATTLLVREADKLTLGQNLNVKVPHSVVKPNGYQGPPLAHTCTNDSIYQGLLCENPWVKLEVVRTLNPATFLPDEVGSPDHNCLEVLDEVFSAGLT